jgi:DNA repair exonuclease SbcCD ATPase subunit
MLPQSPIQASQPSRSAMLPSPSSMSLSNVSSLPPISSPTMTSQSTAQTAHLQDLQHQVSVKTLSFQTLQREYDSLLQKLERQRRKSATLEKKFEVSDAEINSLTDERERLQSQVTSLENQIEELQQTRDEARSQLVANGTQYMRILEMANRLQTQSAEDKKRWEAEKSELEQRIRILEEAMVTGNIGNEESSMGANNDVGSNTPAPTTFSHPTSPPSTTSLAETVNVLRAEIGRLRSRNQNVEAALQSVRMESVYLQAAAKQLAESSGKIEKAAKDAIGG